MSLSLNFLTEYVKNKMYQVHGENNFRDQVLRVMTNYQDFVLSAAQMDALNATPVTVLAAPGAGLVNIPVGLLLRVNSTGFTAFELGSGVLEFRYTGASGSKIVTDIANAVVESATDVLGWNPAIVSVPVVNDIIVAHASADVTAGTGNIQGRLFYKTVLMSEIVA